MKNNKYNVFRTGRFGNTLIAISKTTPSGISLHVSKEDGLYLKHSQVD
jgi:hypothetical protein